MDEVVGDVRSTTALIAVILHSCALNSSRSSERNTIATDHCSTGYFSPSPRIHLESTLSIGTYLASQNSPSLASSTFCCITSLGRPGAGPTMLLDQLASSMETHIDFVAYTSSIRP